MISTQILSGFHYLSSLERQKDLDSTSEFLKSKLWSITDANTAGWYKWYIDYYQQYAKFPSFAEFQEASGIEQEINITQEETRKIFMANMAQAETDALAEQLKSTPLTQRRKLLSRIDEALGSETIDTIKITSTKEFNEKSLQQKEENLRFKFPVKELNDMVIMNPGTVCTIMAPPGSGKTTMSLGCAYLNSVQGDLKSLYLYTENTTKNYEIELRARHSYAIGKPVTNYTLKRGIRPDDEKAWKEIEDLGKSYRETIKGDIVFVPFSSFSPEPLQFGRQLADFIKDNDIDVVYFDYLQRATVFKPIRWSLWEYLSVLCTTFTQVVLGDLNNKPVRGILCAQLNRESEDLVSRKGVAGMTMYSASMVDSLEKDSFVMIGLFAGAEQKAGKEIEMAVLKNRDGEVTQTPIFAPYMPEYACIGTNDFNESSDQGIYTVDALDSILSFDF